MGERRLLAVLLRVLGAVGAVEELPFEELHGNDGKDEHEELVDDQDVEDVLQRCHHAVKHRLEKKGGRSRISNTPTSEQRQGGEKHHNLFMESS